MNKVIRGERNRDPVRVYWRLKLYFATLTALGGLVLSASSDTQSIPIIAVFFAVFGFVFVDWLQLFSLPPIAAYAAMAVAALYCVSDFADLDQPGNHQMVAVAQLLVFVQAILMMQRKTRRIFEQLGVFCLLELIVAAVFNNAISYGLLLIPIGIIGAWALCLLAAVSASEGLESIEGFADEDAIGARGHGHQSTISVSAPDSAMSLASTALRLPRVALMSLAPSVLLVGGIFFYALPRTTDASRVSNKGNALVGFNEKVRLEQIGSMLQNSSVAMRVYVTDRATGQPYRVLGNMYLRGIVLERYSALPQGGSTVTTWDALPLGSISGAQTLPREYFPKRNTDNNFYDSTNFEVICESMNANSLFAVAPYYRTKNNRDIIHKVDRWTIGRRFDENWGTYPRITYEFGTHAFHNGVQTDLVARFAEGESALTPQDPSPANQQASPEEQQTRISREKKSLSYVDALTAYDIDAIPSADMLARPFVTNSRGERRSDYMIAKALERYLATSGGFQYTLNLDSEPIPGMDPIEQFLVADKKGHCQFYASALVMMLRSQGIPARMVVGYNTDEFNELGQHFVARQLHAHAWVEALIDRDQLNANRNIYGQPESKQYWLRLDPTPAASRLRDANGRVGQVLDVAKNAWDDYVVDMDASRQENTLVGGGVTPMNGSYERLVEWLSNTIRKIRAGDLGGGALAARSIFSWPAAVLGVVLAVIAILLLRVRIPTWMGGRKRLKTEDEVPQPTLTFYAQTLEQLERVGLERDLGQTPGELVTETSQKLEDHDHSLEEPLDILTDEYYLQRFRDGIPSENAKSMHLEKSPPIEDAHRPDANVDAALATLRQRIDELVADPKWREQAT